MNKVCSVVVTFNRKNELNVNVEALLKQTVPNDILIYDNASTDGTRELLEERGFLGRNNIIYFRADENLGGAGGFSRGLKMAYDRGYDYIWLMDDDGHPYNDSTLDKCLLKIINNRDRKIIVNSLVLCSEDRLSFQFRRRSDINVVKQICNGNIIENEIKPFNGTLITKEVVKEVGFPKEEFFIKGDEFEYYLRAKSKNVRIITAIDSLYYHPEMITIYKKIFGKEIPLSNESYWKEYYRARNYIYINRKYFDFKIQLKHLILSFIKMCFYQGDKKRKIKYTLKGLYDGYTNKYVNLKI
jgi:GT2 family glycosyltransferase